MTFGYVRVSTKDQHEDRQLAAMAGQGIPPSQLFVDKQSGKDFNRPAYRRMVRRLRPGDVLVVKSIDRLGRDYEEILEQWRMLTKERGVSVRVLDMPLLDNRPEQDLTGALIADIVLQLLSYVAQTERENIRQRQAEGIAAARERGVRFGAPSLPVHKDFPRVHACWREGLINSRAAARLLNVSQGTFLKWSRRHLMKNSP